MRRKLPATVTCSTPGIGLQEGGERVGVLRRHRQLEAARLAGMRFHRLQDVELGLFAEAGQGADAAVARRPVQLLDGLHLEVVVQRLDPLRPQAGNLQQFGDRRRQFAPQAVEQAAVAGVDDFADLGGEVVADAGQPRQVLALFQQRARLLRQFAQRARGIAVGADAERIGALDFEPVGDFLEDGGDVGVVDGHDFNLSHVLSPRTISRLSIR